MVAAVLILLGLVVSIGWAGFVLLSGDDGRDAYLAAVAEVDAALAVDPDRAVRVAETICEDLGASDAAQLAPLVVQRLAGMATVTEVQAGQVIALAQEHVC